MSWGFDVSSKQSTLTRAKTQPLHVSHLSSSAHSISKLSASWTFQQQEAWEEANAVFSTSDSGPRNSLGQRKGLDPGQETSSQLDSSPREVISSF